MTAPWRIAAIAALALLGLPTMAMADEATTLTIPRSEQDALWRARITGFLAKGIIPLIDIESTLPAGIGRGDLDDAARAMDRLGIAVIAFDGGQAPKDGSRGYRWSHHVQRLVNARPDRFGLATNGGTSPNWRGQKSGANSYIHQIEREVKSGAYRMLGEVEFRHYMSQQECKNGRDDREASVPLESANGKRLFALAQKTGLLLSIHLEPEDDQYAALDRMLTAYPGARIAVAHLGQVRRPERARAYGAARLRDLMTRHGNLYFDISTGAPGRVYKCDSEVQDVVIWQEDSFSGQKPVLKPEYKALLTEFSGHFLTGFDFGGGRKPLAYFLEERVENVRRILRDLPDKARHDIAYRNAWRLLTGKPWTGAGAGP
jgi:hypothetical protein